MSKRKIVNMIRYILLLTILLVPSLLFSQEWIVPEDRAAQLSPFEFSSESFSAGESVYMLNCKSCHGDPGKANYQALVPAPGDPASEKFQLNSDGSLQFRISEGHGLMPSFKKVLSPNDIWNVISYIRSFNDNYKQEVALISKLSNVKWSEIKIILDTDSDKHLVTAEVTGLEGKEWTPVPNTEVSISALRYFGDLTIDRPKMTDESGTVAFEMPHDLPGDSTGNILLTARLTDIDLFGEIITQKELAIGLPTDVPALNSQRAMWNIGRKAPVWLLMAYPGVVLTVWAFIFFVLLQLRKVYHLGEDE
ncbi:MAG: cytochrome c [Marinilabiliaceae bacterium]|jgi:hypothetical protein|nr:cytochrome c [Marinilabiliaceae bacterium]